jgi:hypothetical protein
MNLDQTKPLIVSLPSRLISGLKNKVAWLRLDTGPHEFYAEDHYIFIINLLK